MACDPRGISVPSATANKNHWSKPIKNELFYNKLNSHELTNKSERKGKGYLDEIFLNTNDKISAFIFQTPTSSLSHEKRPRSCFSRNFLNSINTVQVTLFLKLHKDRSFLDDSSSVNQFQKSVTRIHCIKKFRNFIFLL